ncbi:MAG: cytidine(C)-cytidine(C)-adenosine (A)]-adding enzyme [Leptospiraceae bacterium]|nr:MAG: cytidine(C)-cytidine(C)-adenosine (A)]-adding enzyme [Leptospiraceae bacterium]
MQIHFSLKNKIPSEIYQKLLEVANIFNYNHYECYFVGGFIRDILLEKNKNFEDIDIATNAKPDEVMKLFKKVIPTGIKHGTVTILYKGLKFECTTYRTEKKYSDYRHPDEIEFAKSIYEDLTRRDFTINAFAYDIIQEILIDEFNGLEDLKNKLIRCIGNPKERFLEDGLRPIRACRFMATLEFQLEINTKNAILDPDVRNAIQSISIERFTEELKKGLKAKKTSLMLVSLYELKLIELFIKEKVFSKISQGFFSYLDCLENEYLKLSYWFWYQDFNINNAAKQLKFSNKLTKICNIYIEFINLYTSLHPFVFLNQNDMNLLINKNFIVLQYDKIKLLKKYKKYLGKLKKEIPNESKELLNYLKIFIIQSSYNIKNLQLEFYFLLNQFFEWLKYVLEKEPIIINDLSINGEDLKQLGYSGKEIGLKLNELLEFVLENPSLNTKEQLKKFLKP